MKTIIASDTYLYKFNIYDGKAFVEDIMTCGTLTSCIAIDVVWNEVIEKLRENLSNDLEQFDFDIVLLFNVFRVQ